MDGRTNRQKDRLDRQMGRVGYDKTRQDSIEQNRREEKKREKRSQRREKREVREKGEERRYER